MAAGSSLTGDTVLCPLARHIYPYLVLVQPMTRPQRTEKMLNQTKQPNTLSRDNMHVSFCNLLFRH